MPASATKLFSRTGPVTRVVAVTDTLATPFAGERIFCRGLATGAPLDCMTAADVMTPDPVSCRLDDTVNQAAFIMEKNQVRRLPVLDDDIHLAGIVSLGDISRHTRHQLAGELIEEVSKPVHRELAATV